MTNEQYLAAVRNLGRQRSGEASEELVEAQGKLIVELQRVVAAHERNAVVTNELIASLKSLVAAHERTIASFLTILTPAQRAQLSPVLEPAASGATTEHRG
jgi:hypothetical protein